MNARKEYTFVDFPKFIPFENAKNIIKQMEKNIFKITVNKNIEGTGFFCKIPFPDENHMLPVLVTNYHIIDKELLNNSDALISIKIKEEIETRKLKLNNRMKYTNKDYDVTIIEIKDSDEIENYLDLDNDMIQGIIWDKEVGDNYQNQTIYIIQYPDGNLGVSFGLLENIFELERYNFTHRCSTERGSSGSPILNLNNKVIGIHKEGLKDRYNLGTFLDYPIKEFIKLNYNKANEINNNNSNEKEIKNGKIKEYYPNGNLYFECDYLNGIKNGIYKEYYENGDLYKKEQYLNGLLNGRREIYHSFQDEYFKCQKPYGNGLLSFEGVNI